MPQRCERRSQAPLESCFGTFGTYFAKTRQTHVGMSMCTRNGQDKQPVLNCAATLYLALGSCLLRAIGQSLDFLE